GRLHRTSIDGGGRVRSSCSSAVLGTHERLSQGDDRQALFSLAAGGTRVPFHPSFRLDTYQSDRSLVARGAPALSWPGGRADSTGACTIPSEDWADATNQLADSRNEVAVPKRTDIQSILLIGSGPIVIGQACEFDYSGTQACKALKEEGYRVVLINSNPATIMTDPELANRTYVEPITIEVVEKVIERERPDALLPTMGGQTALNTTMGLVKRGTLEKYEVKLIGASAEAIYKAEDREAFKHAMQRIGLRVPASGTAHSREGAIKILEQIGFPAIVRPSFTMGGTGGNIAYNREEFEKIVDWGLAMSPVGQLLIEESLIGWKEYELEVMRDLKDNVVIVCPIENLDPMGVHTGDSITVAPAMTLSDKEYQRMRDAAVRIMREIGVDTGGSNVQFGLNPQNGDMVVIEMNPRVSRSSALASKATGFPIAKIAAKLAVGYTLDEITNDITGVTKAS